MLQSIQIVAKHILKYCVWYGHVSYIWWYICMNVFVDVQARACLHVCLCVRHMHVYRSGNNICGSTLLPAFASFEDWTHIVRFESKCLYQLKPSCQPAKHFKCPDMCQQASIIHKDINFQITKWKAQVALCVPYPWEPTKKRQSSSRWRDRIIYSLWRKCHWC